jgi:hypothetical protein
MYLATMPIEYRVDHDRRLVLAEAHGTLSTDEIFRYQREVWSRPDVIGYDELADMSDVRDVTQTTPGRMRELAGLSASMDPERGRSRFAIVAPQQEIFGLGRMYEAYRGLANRSTKRVAVFRDRVEALRWLSGEGAAPDAGMPESPG